MLSSLHLRDLRCFEALSVELGPGRNLFLGGNGQGKTTILEAACILLRLQSQRSSSLMPAVRRSANSFIVRGTAAGHELEFRCGSIRRRVFFDGVEQRTTGEYLRLARVVSFANTDIELVRAGGEGRRRYLDFLGVQVYPSYRPTLRAYERALRARNALLKSAIPRPRELAAYDAPLIEHGLRLQQLRQELVNILAPSATCAYARISAAQEKLTVTFVPGAGEDFANDLASSREEEARVRQTLVGPHRDDLELRIAEMPAAQFASEGQQRSAALALKLAQAEALQGANGAPPLLLIDDVFGELDETRRNALLDHLPGSAQQLITATAMPWRAEKDSTLVYRLREGELVVG